MASSKRFRASLLCLIVLALFAATPALAATGRAILAPSGDEPDASGTVALTEKVVWLRTWGGARYRATVIDYVVTCTGLIPGGTYRLDGCGGYWSSGIADENGKLVIKDRGYSFRPMAAWVYRDVPPSGDPPRPIVVLYGEIVWR